MFRKQENNCALPAFSMLEAIVGMAVTAIIMSVIFVIFSIVSKQLIDFKNQNESIADLNRFTYCIHKDIFNYESLDLANNEIVMKNYSEQIVSYAIKEEIILRKEGTMIDTFRLATAKINMDSVYSLSKDRVFLKIGFNAKVNEKNIDLKFYKRVHANELLN